MFVGHINLTQNHDLNTSLLLHFLQLCCERCRIVKKSDTWAWQSTSNNSRYLITVKAWSLLSIKCSLEECKLRPSVWHKKKDCVWDLWYGRSTDLWYGIVAPVRTSILVFILYSSWNLAYYRTLPHIILKISYFIAVWFKFFHVVLHVELEPSYKIANSLWTFYSCLLTVFNVA